MILAFLRTFGLKLLTNWKVIAVVIFCLAELWGGNALYQAGANKVRREIAQTPAETTKTVDADTTWLHDTTYIKIRGDVILVSDTSDRMTIAQLQEAVQPFKISKPITVTDDKKKVGVSFDASFEAYPIGHTIRNLRFSNIRSTYPKETVTVTKTVIEPAQQHFMDLYVKADIGGIFNHPFMHDMAGMMSTGVEVNIGAVQLNAGIGPAFQLSKVTGLYTFGLKVSTR